MTFAVTDDHIHSYLTNGYTVFRGILPPGLIAELRRACDQGRALVRAQRGPQCQRFQPVGAFDIEQEAFHRYRELPTLRAAIARVLGFEDFCYGDPQSMLGVLIEPAQQAYCTPWHRDNRDHVPHPARVHWYRTFTYPRMHLQSNCALYVDDSTWVVPGSHLRDDLPRERDAFADDPPRAPDLTGLDDPGRERACLAYAQHMPGAVRLHLEPGDFCLYRSTLWHLGQYTPYGKRATLHDLVDTPQFQAWRAEFRVHAEHARKALAPAPVTA